MSETKWRRTADNLYDVTTSRDPFVCVCVCADAPRITQAPRDQKVVDNGIATFICLATGNPSPDVYFRRAGGRRIATRHRHDRYSVITIPHGAVLRVNPVSARRDDGLIDCVAENGLGDPATASATLQVYAEGLGESTTRVCARASAFVVLIIHIHV